MKLLIALFTAAMLTAACSSGGSGGEETPEASAKAGTVKVDDFSFTPETIEVATGEEVTWTVVEGSSAHTVKFDDEESENLEAGDTYSRTFDTAGEQSYVCGIHPQMTGTVAVK